MLRQQAPFRVTRHGEPILDLLPSQIVQTGVRYNALIPGLVPEIEERDAARFNGSPWFDWRKQPYDERVTGVAYYRLSRIVEMHREEAVSTEMKRRTRLSAKAK